MLADLVHHRGRGFVGHLIEPNDQRITGAPLDLTAL